MTEMTPAHKQLHVQALSSAGRPPIVTAGEPGTQGDAVAGMQGCGVKTPAAADVAAMTCGLAGLLPKKRGPHGGHKLTAEIVTFLQQAQARDASLRPVDLAQDVADRFALTVHPRSIERALARQEKKRPR